MLPYVSANSSQRSIPPQDGEPVPLPTDVYVGTVEIGSASWDRFHLPALIFVCFSAAAIVFLAFWMTSVMMLG